MLVPRLQTTTTIKEELVRLLLGVAVSIAVLRGADASAERVRDAAKRAIVLIQKGQVTWYKKQSCTSCHNQILPAMAFRTAREHGIPVDESIAHADAAVAFRGYSNLDRIVQDTDVIDPPSMGYHLLAGEAAGVRPSLATAAQARLLAARQEPDGHWEPVDNRPPQHYSPFTDTITAALALQHFSHSSQQADTHARLARARNWLLAHTPRATEERVFQLIGAHLLECDAKTQQKMTAELKGTQQPDGGWNSRDGLLSDAYSTGQALYVLCEFGGVPITDPNWWRGIDFLLRTQAKDGSWHVVSRLRPPAPVSPPYFETGYPYGHDQFISLMGASWAVMALADALGPGKQVELPPLEEAKPTEVEDWVEKVLFGSVSDLKAMLDHGFDPNSATKSGGTTALMLAAPNFEKMKLLLDRGANVNARSKTRYSALLVTAQYPRSAEAMNLLLDHSAEVRLPKGQGAPLFNASPIMLTSISGNAEIIGRLRQKGDRLDDKMLLLGMFPVTPALEIAGLDRAKTMAALLDAGMSVNEKDPDGISLLGWAAIANRLEMARLLIQRGADVNHVDKNGMTPLLYAASIDFGDTSMIDLLLKSGARADARTKEGLTALELARKYKHTQLLASLATKH
jgi:ankyrin repeat protein